MLAAARAAEDEAGAVTIPLDVAGVRIDLVFAGSRLIGEMLPALRHLVAGGETPPEVRVHVWDSHTTGVGAPPAPCNSDHFTDRGDIWGFSSPRFRVAFHYGEFSVNAMDLDSGEAVYWVRIADAMPYWSKAAPLRTILHWSLEPRGVQLLHAAAVGDDNGAVLITGKGGVGKSTTALTSIVHGLRYAADDYLAVRVDPEPTVYSLYNTAKFNAVDMPRHPALAPYVVNAPVPEGEKAVVRLYPAFEDRIMRAMRLRAVLTPRVVRRTETGFEPADAIKLRRAAAFTTLSQLPYAGQQTQSFIEAMVDRLPGFEIQLGSDPAGVVAAIRGLLSRDDATLRAAAVPRQPADATRDRPLISVIVPTYNGASFLREAIDSILAQDYPTLEIIVVDDGSTDGIQAAVAALPVDVRFFRQPNLGPAAARNRGIRDACGQFIAFLDVDDLWPANNLNTLLAAFERNPSLHVVNGHAQMMVRRDGGGYDYAGNPAESYPYFIGAALYRRDVFHAVGLFDEGMRLGEDTEWFNRLFGAGLPTERLPEVTLMVRRHGANMTAGKTKQELNLSALVAFKKALDRQRLAQAPRQAGGAA
jgi:hypothetical protein